MTSIPISGARRARSQGFTLVELMIAVAIVAILSRVAYASYINQVYKSHRVDAKTALLDLATREERLFSVRNQYETTNPSNLGYSGTAFPINVQSSNGVYYTLSFLTGATATTYTAVATPQGKQANDTCGTYQLSQLGVQSNTGNTTATASCW